MGLHQPLIVKSKVEKEDVRVARQALTQEKSPTALGNINSVSDIPIPKVFASKAAEMMRSLQKQNQCQETWTSGDKRLTTPCQSPLGSKTL